MLKKVIHPIIVTFIFYAFSCTNDTNFRNPYQNDGLEILDATRTLSRIKEIEVIKRESGDDDIIIHAFDGSEATFFSNNSCDGPGPSYNIIASIPSLGIVFIDRTYSCDLGETAIMVSLKDGISRELRSSIWNTDQFSLSPDGSWLVISSSDCSMGYQCRIEILDLKNSPNSLLVTKFFNDKVCANGNLNWFSEDGFTTKTAIGEDLGDCIYRPIKFEYVNKNWSFDIK